MDNNRWNINKLYDVNFKLKFLQIMEWTRTVLPFHNLDERQMNISGRKQPKTMTLIIVTSYNIAYFIGFVDLFRSI